MKNLKKIIFSVFLVLTSLFCFAQENNVKMADLMRSNGSIYVVVAVVTIILTGLILYLFRLDRKISKLEKEK
ncbi:MAG: CcmD family protein [Chitinophagaceae bacterium]